MSDMLMKSSGELLFCVLMIQGMTQIS